MYFIFFSSVRLFLRMCFLNPKTFSQIIRICCSRLINLSKTGHHQPLWPKQQHFILQTQKKINLFNANSSGRLLQGQLGTFCLSRRSDVFFLIRQSCRCCWNAFDTKPLWAISPSTEHDPLFLSELDLQGECRWKSPNQLKFQQSKDRIKIQRAEAIPLFFLKHWTI